LAEGIIAIIRRALMQQRSIANAAVQNQKSESTGSNTGYRRNVLMNVKVAVAVLLIGAVPVYAQAQSPSAPKVTKADAQKVVKIISGNKAKTQTYCDMAKLFNQIEREKNIKKTAELNRKLDELAKRLGSEYAALVSGIPNVNPNSQEGQEISSTLAALDSLCPK
jgi:hypothetical protein